MHISNERYFDDRQRHDLALRMIRHEARTCTIRACTGLTDDRIRRLYQTYASHMPAIPMRRHRGKSPRQVSFFTRNAKVQFEASLLASVFAALGLLDSAATTPGSIHYGDRFCDAYETHIQLLRPSVLTFEHAWFLLQILCRKTAPPPNQKRPSPLDAQSCQRDSDALTHSRSWDLLMKYVLAGPKLRA
jgi:hypothetical protein